jgi:hypothetical protein
MVVVVEVLPLLVENPSISFRSNNNTKSPSSKPLSTRNTSGGILNPHQVASTCARKEDTWKLVGSNEIDMDEALDPYVK